MRILFLSIYDIEDSNSGYIYADLIKEFAKHNHKVYAATVTENKNSDSFIDTNGVHIVRVKSGKIQKTGKIRKVLNLWRLDGKVIRAIRKAAKGVRFDLVITMVSNLSLYKTAKYFKRKHNASVYMALKDIFPQNAVDIGMLSKRGVKGIIYRFFRKKEQRLYAISDKIGCMSQANGDYILKHNPTIPADKVEVCPNCIEPIDVSLNEEEKTLMRNKYGIPLDKKVFVYGGNLGKPQGISFLIDCLRSQKENSEVFFLIVGNGTEYKKLAEYYETEKPTHVKVMPSLPRDDYDRMIAACDVGMIFLDYRFTIPNFPSRLLSYMQAGLPIFACTDVNTDIGKVITDGGFGWWCESNDVTAFAKGIERAMVADCTAMGKQAQQYLAQEYSTAKGYEIIMESRQSGLK